MPNKKSVFLLGVFDMFHSGHAALLEQAAALGDVYVGLVTDRAVREQKGPNRPIISETHRKYILENIKGVVGVMLVDGFKIPDFVLADVNIIIVGADQNHITNLSDIPPEKRHNLPRTEGVSTSDIIKRIKEE